MNEEQENAARTSFLAVFYFCDSVSFSFLLLHFLHDYLLLRLSYVIFEKKTSNSAVVAVCCYFNIPKHFSADYGA